MIAAALAFKPGGFEQSCLLCQDPEHEELRQRWGCDEETEHPQFVIDCPLCLGKATNCPECNGSNQIAVRRCPNALVTQDHFDVCSGVAFLEAGGALPVAGGWADQSATFIDAMVIVQREKAQYDEQRGRRGGGT